MSYDVNWLRWIKASVAKHFKPNDIAFFVEGFERDTEGLTEWIELRLSGPNHKQTASRTWRFDLDVNLLIMMNSGPDAYRMERLQGIAIKPFTDCLEVFKLGNTEPDDNTQFGCMRLITTGSEKIIVTNFGKLKPDISQYQSTIEGHYQMILDV